MKQISRGTFIFLFIVVLLFSLTSEQTAFQGFRPTDESIYTARDYSINIYDGSLNYFTMRQVDQNFVDVNRLASRGIDEVLGIPILWGRTTVSTVIKYLLPYITNGITHEEAHRSILTHQNIGSISQPFSDSSGACYVKGVSNQTLQNLRDSDLPTFIRLHTAGLESDYAIITRETELAAFLQDDPQNVLYDCFIRTIFSNLYMTDGTDKKIRKINFKEEKKEFDRDIVGHDVFGMAFHLYRLEEDFSRYKNYSDLSNEEIKFLERISKRSYINFINLAIYGGINIAEHAYLNGSMGYSLAPFGDFIDERIFFKYRKINLQLYTRQYQNRSNWFPATGLGIVDYKPFDWISLTTRGHLWKQPKALDFNTSESQSGGAIEFEVKGFLPNKHNTSLKSIGLSIGGLYKTAGFMPEIESHEQTFQLNTGVVFKL